MGHGVCLEDAPSDSVPTPQDQAHPTIWPCSSSVSSPSVWGRMRSERVSGDVCGMARRWAISPTLALMLHDLETWAAERLSADVSPGGFRWPGVWIISGHRRAPIISDLNPTEPSASNSRHLPCPALAVDLRVGNAPASLTPPTVWQALGTRWETLGGRWGGRFDPPDFNHFDISGSLGVQ